METIIGSIVSEKYKILCLLGGGSYGQTYLARSIEEPKQRYVLKQFKPVNNPLSPTDIQDAIKRFIQEATTLEKLQQEERIPTFIESIEENNQRYIVQEFINGKELEYLLLEEGNLKEEGAVFLLKYFLETLSFIHEKNIIHRDIKPSNIIIRYDDLMPVLIDFGAIKSIEVQASRNRNTNTVAIGTQEYMPGEQARGKPRFSSDVYSLGLVILKSVLGDLPEEDEDTGEFKWDNGAINPNLSKIIVKMTHTHFIQRYTSAKEALEELNDFIASHRYEVNFQKPNSLIHLERMWIERAYLARANKLHDEATDLFRLALELKKSSFSCWFNLGISYFYTGKYKESITCYCEALKIRRKSHSAWFHKGVSFFRMDRHKNAINCFKKVIQLEQDHALAYLYLSICLHLKNYFTESRNALEQALTYRPSIYDEAPRILVRSERAFLDQLLILLLQEE